VPLAGPEFSPGKRTDVWSQMITMVEIGSLAGAVDIVATVFTQRAPGMTFNRIPLFVWTQLITSLMIIFAMPAVMLVSTMLALDRLTNVSTHFFNPAEGGDALLWQHLFWFFAHPEVYIIFLPATGFVSMIVSTFSRRPTFGYTGLVLSLTSTAFIGFGVWVHHMFTTPLPALGQGLFTASSLLVTIPTAVQIFCWITTLWGGRPQFKTPLIFVIGFVTVFVVGGLTGVMLASVSIDLQVHDTFFVVAHLHYVLIGGAVFPLFGAIYYWFPKWTGRMLNEHLGKWNFWLLFAGFNLTFFPMHQLGLKGMTRRIYTYLPETGWGDLNLLATAGALIMGIAIIVFVLNVLWSRRAGLVAGPNPWQAGSLEWSTISPPPTYNFQHPPAVGARDPLWHGEPTTVVTGLGTAGREVLTTTIVAAIPDHRHELPGNSVWPLFLALAVGLTFVAVIFHPIAVPIGAVLAFIACWGWFWQGNEPDRIVRGAQSLPGISPVPILPK
jgi:cytochrome c oxidase subunit 1